MWGWLIAIGSGLYELVKYLVTQYGKRVVIGTAAIAAYGIVLVTAIAYFNSSLSSLLVSLPNDSFSLAGLSLVPNNALTCALFICGMKIAQVTFYWSIGMIKLKLFSK